MKVVTFTQALRETLEAEMVRDPSIVLMGEDIGVYGGSFGVTRGLVERFGAARVRDTPISEQALAGCAIGAAVGGLRPIAEFMFADFSLLALDQIANLAAKLQPIYGISCPVVFRAPFGAGRGYGATHSQCLERFFFGVPGIKIAVPSTAADAAGLLQSAIRDPNPVFFFEHKLLYPLRFEVPEEIAPVPFGKAAVTRAGDDVTIVGWGFAAHEALRAAETLAAEGVSAEVVDLRTLAPLDIETIVASAQHTGRLLVVEEGPLTGGIGAEISAQVAPRAFEYLEHPIARLASPDLPVPAARELEADFLPSAARIAAAARDLMA